MRLINTSTIQLHEFEGTDIPPYAILSHTWGPEEVSFQSFYDSTGKDKAGYSKILKCCALAASHGWRFAWIDTCCIDKKSSAELSEAINSMFEWYRKAKVCYAYLADVQLAANDGHHPFWSLSRSRWFTRGWTLQELLAPATLIFYDQDWREIGTKTSMSSIISAITGITWHDITHFENECIAVKMSWASKRETTRIEDTAYCLMGLFGVNMPLLYGEGTNAFIRLQLEILKISDDETIFAWRGKDGFSGLLAPSPAEFRSSGRIRRLAFDRDRPAYSMTNKGLEMGLLLLRKRKFEIKREDARSDWEVYVTPLNCTLDSSSEPLAIFLWKKSAQSNDFRRCSPKRGLRLMMMRPVDAAAAQEMPRETAYIKQIGEEAVGYTYPRSTAVAWSNRLVRSPGSSSASKKRRWDGVPVT